MAFRKAADVEMAQLKDELLLFHPTSKKFYVMNPTAAFLWTRLDEHAAEADLAGALVRSFSDTSLEKALNDVRVALANMVSLGLIVNEGDDPAAPGT